ncbi:MAG TPA: hypothetical protein VLA19_27000 [Herpetosiphonaceae bacterium]|nr:hypothetical protein [Herpetosiphonaceae bacterium]
MRDALRDPRYLRMAGGTIAVIGGIYTTVWAFIVVFVGGTGLFGGGWASSGLAPAVSLISGILLIFLGALAISARNPFPGVMVIITAVIGAITGGLLLTLFMILPVIGGAMSAVAAGRQSRGDTPSVTATRGNVR